MKKQYIQPTVLLIETMPLQSLLTGSNFTVNVVNSDYDEDNMTDLARQQNSVWDDED